MSSLQAQYGCSIRTPVAGVQAALFAALDSLAQNENTATRRAHSCMRSNSPQPSAATRVLLQQLLLRQPVLHHSCHQRPAVTTISPLFLLLVV